MEIFTWHEGSLTVGLPFLTLVVVVVVFVAAALAPRKEK